MLNDVSFCVRQGEILGVAGVQGNGQTELIEVISGMISNYEGKVTFSNHEIKPEDSPLTRRQAGLGHIPEDRQTMGAALGATLTENFIMGGLSDPAYTSPGVISYTRAGDVAKRQYENFDVKYASLNEPAGALSGGNLQKAIVAREIYRDPQILIAAQPSRGVDIGATLFIHRELIKLRECGKAILLVSGELSEVMSLSDRVIVLYNGAIVGEVDPKKSTEEEIGLLMAGMKGWDSLMNFEFRQKSISFRTAVVAVVIGTLIGFLLVALFGYNPVEIFSALLDGAFGSGKNIATSLRWATPLMFTGVAAALSFRGGMFNFGIDGQLYVGSLASTIVGVTCTELPGMLLIPLMMFVGMFCGALWAYVPAFIRVKLGGSEIVPALMMNYMYWKV